MNTYQTPIHLACLSGNTEEIIRLLKQDCRLVDAKDHEDTPLHCAVTEVVARLLIECKADINARGWMGQTPLHVAAAQGRLALVRLLIQQGAHVNAQRERGDIPLHWAVNAEIAQVLIEHGATLEEQDCFGQRPLHWAARSANANIVSLLLSYGADVHARDQWGKTPLALAVGNSKSRETVQLLLHAGADINAQSHSGSTPLHEAFWRAQHIEDDENEDIVQLLLDSGANIHARDLQGKTPFHVAKGKPRLLAILSDQMEKIGPVSALVPEQFVMEKIKLHPHKQEAVTLVRMAILARWALDNSPRLLTSKPTTYARFQALAVSPDGETIALAPAEEPVEFRRWDDFSLLPYNIPIRNEATALAFSPNGRWFALADRHEKIHLLDRVSGRVTTEIEGGEWTSSILFDSTSTLLASACSFQGGGYVRLDKLNHEGHLIALYELWRSDVNTPSKAFVDSLIHLAFSPDGQWLALFESSGIYNDLRRPSGWRGNLALYSVDTGTLQWQASIDAQVTGDKRSLKEAGYPEGFFTEILFVSSTEIVCGATQGRVVFYDVGTGKLIRSIVLPTKAAIRALSLDREAHQLWVVLDNGKLVAHPLFEEN